MSLPPDDSSRAGTPFSTANISRPNTPLSALSFDDGDIIIRAGDTDFKVHILLLCLSSPFFKSMFSLPQPKLGNSEIPVITMDADPTCLDFILRSIYPNKRPLAASIEQALKILEIADKFEFECVVEAVRASLIDLLAAEPNPLRSWAIAVHHGLEEAQRVAASVLIPTGSNSCPKSWLMSTHSNMPGWWRRRGGRNGDTDTSTNHDSLWRNVSLKLGNSRSYVPRTWMESTVVTEFFKIYIYEGIPSPLDITKKGSPTAS